MLNGAGSHVVDLHNIIAGSLLGVFGGINYIQLRGVACRCLFLDTSNTYNCAESHFVVQLEKLSITQVSPI